MPRAFDTGHRGSRLRHRKGRLRLQKGRHAELEQLLDELAYILLPQGITPEEFSALAREAFIRAATERSRLRNGRVNRSKIAALTGLSRREIKRILDVDRAERSLEHNRSSRTPSERVVQGWLSDRRFRTVQGQPKLLAIAGGASSFQRLVKEYGGDISPRGVLEELVRSRMVRKLGRRVELCLSKLRNPNAGLGRFRQIVPVLVDGLRIATTEGKRPTDPLLFRLRLQANSETELALIRERCQSGVQTLLYGLKASLKNQLTVPFRKRTPKHVLNVTAMIAGSKDDNASKSGNRR